jgi:hypothetical protein
VVVTNIAGSVTSAVATLTVNVPVFIMAQPQSLTVTQGQTANFSVVAAGTPTLTYQWYFNGAPLGVSATNALLIVSPARTNNAGSYSVVVNNAYGSATSAVASLAVNVPPGIVTQPQNQAVAMGQTASFSVVASGTGPLNYQWNCNGSPMNGATSSTLALPGVHTNDAASYTVTVSNSAGSMTSAAASLTITNPIISLTVPPGGGMTPTGFTFQVSVPIGITYVIQASTNMTDWTSIATNLAVHHKAN